MKKKMVVGSIVDFLLCPMCLMKNSQAYFSIEVNSRNSLFANFFWPSLSTRGSTSTPIALTFRPGTGSPYSLTKSGQGYRGNDSFLGGIG